MHKGKHAAQIKIAQNMLSKGAAISFVSAVTGLSVESVEALDSSLFAVDGRI